MVDSAAARRRLYCSGDVASYGPGRLNFIRLRRSLQHQPCAFIGAQRGHIMYDYAPRQSAFALSDAWLLQPLHAHKAPTPEPNDDPLPGEHPVPQEEPVPSPKPESASHNS
jgi:hypothetical protein